MAIRLVRVLCFAIVVLALTAVPSAQVAVTVAFGPPPLPVYVQPPCPAEGYIWIPGYWSYDYDYDDYFWVPGTWVVAPEVGFLWTPGWWGWEGGGFIFHQGYWGPQVGFYGGINYGYGYFGEGYEGGRWEHGRFFYNRSVNNVNVTNIHNVYNTTVVNNPAPGRVSYNGGNGGITARPTAQDEAAARERHAPPVAAQTQHVQAARSDQQLRASVNQGKPPVAATPKPGELHDRAAVPAEQAGGPYHPPAANREPANRATVEPQSKQPPANPSVARPENNASQPSTAVHPNELPPRERPQAPDTGNAQLNQKNQQQQEQLRAQQDQERQKLQQQQDQEHQRLAQQKADQAKNQQLEQKHQQQTQQLQQQQERQQQQLQARQQQQPKQQGKQPPPHATQAKPPNEKEQQP